MASETVDPINWSHTPPSWAVPPELHVLHGVKSQDLLHHPGLERASKGMPDQRTTCAATQGAYLHQLWASAFWVHTFSSCWLLLFGCIPSAAVGFCFLGAYLQQLLASAFRVHTFCRGWLWASASLKGRFRCIVIPCGRNKENNTL